MLHSRIIYCLKLHFGRGEGDLSPFCAATPVLVMSALGFKARVDPFFACFVTYGILSFISTVTPPADYVEFGMADEPFQSMYLQMCQQALVDDWAGV